MFNLDDEQEKAEVSLSNENVFYVWDMKNRSMKELEFDDYVVQDVAMDEDKIYFSAS